MTPLPVPAVVELGAPLVLPPVVLGASGLAGPHRSAPAPLAVIVPLPVGHPVAPGALPGDVVLPHVEGHVGDWIVSAVVAADLERHGVRVHSGNKAPEADPFATAGARMPNRLGDLTVAGTVGELATVLDQSAGSPRRGAVVLGVVMPAGSSFDGGSPTPDGGLTDLGAHVLPSAVLEGLERWAGAVGAHEVMLAAPRSFCAGVQRAVEIVQRAIERYGAPVYVRRQIVHNVHVVDDLRRRGAVFVEELDEVPEDATVVLAAHGVAPSVRAEAERRQLTVVDATCPLVAKVHREARRFASEGRRIVLVGHAEHEEVAGTVGEAPDHIEVLSSEADVASLPARGDEPIAYLTQTTLAIDETATVVGALRRRFPHIVGPAADDICYATQNRQDAVRAMAEKCQLVLVVGSANSSNTARLVEVARRQGCRAELVEDETELRWEWLHGVTRVGVTAGASAPELLVQRLVDVLAGLGPASISEHRTTEEHVRFSLPPQVR